MIKSRFSILLHILTLLADNQNEWLSSSFIAGSLNINPVLVRNEISALKTMHWLESKEGNKGGIRLAIKPKNIKLSQVFMVAKGDKSVFSLGKNTPNPKCNIGKQINAHLTQLYADVDAVIIESLSGKSLSDFKNQF